MIRPMTNVAIAIVKAIATPRVSGSPKTDRGVIDCKPGCDIGENAGRLFHQLIPPFTVEAKMTAEVAATTTTQRLTTATL
jgi:hypothetical protein